MNILCVCEHGNVRSGALAYLLKTIYGHDAIACGIKENSKETRSHLYAWADWVIAMDTTIFTILDREFGHPDNLLCCDVGNDIWHNPYSQELQHKILKQLKRLNL